MSNVESIWKEKKGGNASNGLTMEASILVQLYATFFCVQQLSQHVLCEAIKVTKLNTILCSYSVKGTEHRVELVKEQESTKLFGKDGWNGGWRQKNGIKELSMKKFSPFA